VSRETQSSEPSAPARHQGIKLKENAIALDFILCGGAAAPCASALHVVSRDPKGSAEPDLGHQSTHNFQW